ncbi:NADH dehydrogenase [ubiquinone] 1 alpha subcomplex assembly factor 3 [Corythoichthys intestinalis]|uniref:NADH dehydrogenase [ubiquinone] 1 alpha subcomplex assembly factor 3 n=1 Tax=Corythoichthys intestinalis TaxID=161448 RepID=UPI0025A5903E|nr:NADH dehydrogenase [ubiquinone] 1 alpha subcomplex assembly factor 3 [Corythoichthys intestinalis]XP_057702525.1 NADH dehydrogenase [ubiquinone] 1 alpha subcomplex assembly factor 3 [Corythoichthys intestinalis]XP_061813665.1 NADH dehydrogenase [ubiquinone] 1 alpha subcomplex assembly factor 3-like [Nerophis lumbriciformis]
MAVAGCAKFLLQRSSPRLIFPFRSTPAFISPFQCRGHRLGPSDDEMYQRTTVSVMKKEPGSGFIILGYSAQGFNINGNKVFGPCAVLPPSILQWKVGGSKDITQESVSLFHMIVPQIEILVLGTGARLERIHPSVLTLLRSKGIAVEVQDTANACATFNFLISENRVVAAGLIPPSMSMELEVKNQ